MRRPAAPPFRVCPTSPAYTICILIDERRNHLAVVLVLGGGENEPHPGSPCSLDGLQHALSFAEAAQKEQVVVGC